MHGFASIVYRIWTKLHITMPKWLAWLITFQFVNVGWVFFRAESVEQAFSIVKSMIGLNGFNFPVVLAAKFNELLNTTVFIQSTEFLFSSKQFVLYCFAIFIFMLIVAFSKNSHEKLENFSPSFRQAIFISIMGIISILSLNKVSEFIYFNF